MGRFAIVENGTVTNVIEADADFATSIGAIIAENVSIGDLYADGSFSKGEATMPALSLLIATNNAAYEVAIGKLTSDYPAAEISTWERQRAEAVAWGANNTALTPWIDTAAAVRGIDRVEYLGRTLAKVNAFSLASAYLTGRRQGIDDQLRAATTAAQLAAITINYTLPGM